MKRCHRVDEGGVGLHSRNGKIMHEAQRSKQQGMCGFHNPEGIGHAHSIMLKLKEPETRADTKNYSSLSALYVPQTEFSGSKAQ